MSVQVYLRGDRVERGTGKPGFRWVQGYYAINPDNGNKLYPPVTRTEAHAQAKRDGEKALFFNTEEELTAWVAENVKPCPHYEDNQGFCHKCGILMNEDWARQSGYFQEGMVEGK
mgnify:CR=1 FL=1